MIPLLLRRPLRKATPKSSLQALLVNKSLPHAGEAFALCEHSVHEVSKQLTAIVVRKSALPLLSSFPIASLLQHLVSVSAQNATRSLLPLVFVDLLRFREAAPTTASGLHCSE